MSYVKRFLWDLKDLEIGVKYLKKIAAKYNQEFHVDEYNRDAILSMIAYFHGFENIKLPSGVYGSPSKGLLLIGPPGTGKTMLMQLFATYVRIDNMFFQAENRKCVLAYPMVRTAQIVKEFKMNGYDHVDQYINRRIYCFDDLGEEPKAVSFFGTTENIMQYILEGRYNRQSLTLATSNYRVSELEEMYGERVRSRMNEMFNIITLAGPDRRRKAK